MSGGMRGKLRSAPDESPACSKLCDQIITTGDFAEPGQASSCIGMAMPFGSAPLFLSATTIRVLLCDDVQAFRALMRYSLEEEEGIEVVGEAADGNEGIRQAAELRPDVVLLDLSMPECDGLEAIPAMRRRSPTSKIVALSGFAAGRMAEPVMASGAQAYLEKGVDMVEIVAAIRDVHLNEAA
jgi:CheY-like chemotaxis protein